MSTRASHSFRGFTAGRATSRISFAEEQKPLSVMERPGAFQCALLRALELPKAYRDVFLLKEIRGHSLAEIATILGISIDTAILRLKRARREIGGFDNSTALEQAG